MILVLHLVASSRGGGAAHVRDLALGLDRLRYACRVGMPLDGGPVRPEQFESAGLPFYPVDIASGLRLAAILAIRRLARGVNVLHAHGARAALFARLAAASLGAARPRVVYSLHGFALPFYPAPRRAMLLAIERGLAPFTDWVVAACEAERRDFVQAGIVPPQRVQVVRNGIEVERFDAPLDPAVARAVLGVAPGTFLVTTACRLYKPRDFDTLLAAFGYLVQAAPPAHLLIAGDGPLSPQVERQIRALGLGPHVTLAGWRADLPALYAASDVFVLTTWGWEGLPLTVMEAMAAGRPVIATRAGGTPEIIAHGETGFLVERRDVGGLAEALVRLADLRLRQQMGAAGQLRARREFRLEHMVSRTDHLYATLVSSP